MSTSPREGRSGWARLADADMIAALAAVAIGVAAIVVSVMQVRIMREEQHASVWPRIMISTGYTPGEYLEFQIQNAGIGPAVLKSVTASIDGRAVTSWQAAFQAMVGDQRWHGSMTSVSQGTIVPAGGRVTAFRLDNAVLFERVARELGRLKYDICYCSVYDRCWATGIRDTTPEPSPVRTCPVPRPQFK